MTAWVLVALLMVLSGALGYQIGAIVTLRRCTRNLAELRKETEVTVRALQGRH